jgi:serine/threonine protein kinase
MDPPSLLTRNVYIYDKENNKIGRGANSVVYEAKIQDRPEETVAVKETIVEKSHRDCNGKAMNVINEVKILRALNHSNIVKYVDFYYKESLESSCYYTVLELMKGGELFQRIVKHKTFSELAARNYAITMLNTVKYCHDRNIVHR